MKVLVAEDNSSSRLLLQELLTQWGYDVLALSDGDEAWEALQRKDAPRLALLDWEMPGLLGIDICRKLRERKEAPLVYTILVTCRDEKADLFKGLDSGAHDYLAKPYDGNELRRRVEVGVRILEYERALTEKNEELHRYAGEMEALVEARAQQLVHTDRLATLGVMCAGVAHEINNPTSFISGNIQTLERFWTEIEGALLEGIKREAPNRDKYQFILAETPPLLKGVRSGVTRISRIVQGLKAYCRQDSGKATECDVNRCVSEALTLCSSALERRTKVTSRLDQTLPTVKADPQQIVQVLVNLFINASDAMSRQKRGELQVETCSTAEGLRVVVEDNGPGIPPDILKNIWDPFFTTKEPGKGTGLGLAISQGIVESHGGKIMVENAKECGVRFTIELPRNREAGVA